MPQPLVTRHTHTLPDPSLQEKRKSSIRSFFGSLVNEQPSSSNPKVQTNNRKRSKTNEQLAIEKSQFHFGRELTERYGTCKANIGSGGSSLVWLSHKPETGTSGKLFAIKGFRRDSGGNEADFRSRLTSEHLLLSSIDHENVLQALDLVEDEKGSLFTVLEHCDGGDLYSLVFQRGNLEVVEADCFFKQMMRGVDYLHRHSIAHRDLKPENMVLTRQGVVKIADFGESERFRVADVEVSMVGGMQGASPYVAPEVYTSDHFSARAADVWSMGVIYLTMRLGRYLWITAELEDQYYVQYTQARRTEGGYAWIEGLGKVGLLLLYEIFVLIECEARV